MNSPKIEAFTDTSERKTAPDMVEVGTLTQEDLWVLKENSQAVLETLRAHANPHGILIDPLIIFSVIQEAIENVVLDNVSDTATAQTLALNKKIIDTVQKLLEQGAPGAVSVTETAFQKAVRVSQAARPRMMPKAEPMRELKAPLKLDETTAQRMLKKIQETRQDKASDSVTVFENQAA